MRIVVTGATGNVGTSVVEALLQRPEVTSVLGLARRKPAAEDGRTAGRLEWANADIRHDDLVPLFRGADVIVHLAWLFQPTHRSWVTWRANVGGSERVLRAVAEAAVRSLVFASSVGAYSPAEDDRPVTEQWPTDGWPQAAYMREKAYVERLADAFERRQPQCRVVRMRPAFTFKYTSAEEQRRLFAGPLVPNPLVRPGLLPLLPLPSGLRFQAVHSEDVGRAYALAAVGHVGGPFNLAAEPVFDRDRIAELLRTRVVGVPPRAVRAVLAFGWRLRMLPAQPDLFDALMRLPVMDATRARTELGWTPRMGADDALREFLAGFRAGAGGNTAPLAADGSIRMRLREFTTASTDPVDAGAGR